VSHEHVSSVAFNRHAIGVSPPRAALLRPGERSQFLQAIAYELADVDPIDDEAVKGAVEAIMDAAARR
jgi:hypothetical protein